MKSTYLDSQKADLKVCRENVMRAAAEGCVYREAAAKGGVTKASIHLAHPVLHGERRPVRLRKTRAFYYQSLEPSDIQIVQFKSLLVLIAHSSNLLKL